METFADRLKKLRIQKNLSPKQMSTMTAIPLSTYREWEAGRQIKGQPYVKIAQALNVSLYELLTGECAQIHEAIEIVEKLEIDLKKLKGVLQSLN